MKILFVNMSSLCFTVTTPEHEPLGGSETSLCYLARALALRGHRVVLAANLPVSLPQKTPHEDANVMHYGLEVLRDAVFFEQQSFDFIVLCNVPAAASALRVMAPNARIIFWAHVLPDQASMQALSQMSVRDVLSKTVFVSRWQKEEVEKVFGALHGTCVIGNGIAPSFEHMFASPDELLTAKQNRAIYASTPYRGLSVLARAMEGFDRPTKVALFSSMRVYQESDGSYADLFDRIEKIPTIIRHGSVSQPVLAQHFRSAAFLFYPCIYPETFCIVAAEAMAAGMNIVTTELGALPETTMQFASLVPICSTDGDRLVEDYRTAMCRTVDQYTTNPTIWARTMFAQVQAANANYSWAARAALWEEKLKEG